jgi:glycosyltransferase involved in cell wall biosynthesis
MDSVDLSIIIPTFHRENELVQAIHSVLTDARDAFEVLVADDSPEGSAEPFVKKI